MKFYKTLPLVALAFCSNISHALTEQIKSLETSSSPPVVSTSYVNFDSKDLKKGAQSKYISILQEKLGLPQTGIYDDETVTKVKMLQSNAGLTPSGTIDKTTWIAIFGIDKDNYELLKNSSVENMKSILARDANKNNKFMAVVNIPSQKIYLYEKSDNNYVKVFESKVIVGRPATQTPLVDFDIVSIKYNPTWTPTTNMLKRNVYKGKSINTAWLKNHHLKVIDENGEERTYEELPDVSHPRFVQELGEFNALGNLKFETSSKDDIYLHDTNERHIFDYNQRTYSSGCIRVQKYKDLASIISSKNSDHIDKQINKRETIHERVAQKVPVYIMYSQVTADKDIIQVSPDVYNLNNR